jgi:hypothetical protein
VAKIADGTSGCSNGGGGCWQVNGGTPIAAASATKQAITLDTIGGSGSTTFVSAVRIKTSTAFTGTISKATATLGNTRATSFYYAGNMTGVAAGSAFDVWFEFGLTQ